MSVARKSSGGPAAAAMIAMGARFATNMAQHVLQAEGKGRKASRSRHRGTERFIFGSTNATPPSLSTFLLRLIGGTRWRRYQGPWPPTMARDRRR